MKGGDIMDITGKIKSTLLEMKLDSLKLNASPSDPEYRKLIDKYDTIFTGEKMNKVNSIEVAHYLKIDHNEFLSLLPKAAKELGMSLEGLHALGSKDLNSTDAYYINLY